MNHTDEIWDAIEHAAVLLREACYAVVLTGAGMSTPSGIPDFRTPELGLWESTDPMEVVSLYAFRRDPQKFYDWMRPMVKTILTADPNPGHRALTKLEESGFLKAIITQNIDDLHQRAGSHEVLELHGHIRKATCISCYRTQPTGELLKDFLGSGAIPHCPVCGGVMKPNVVLLGEQLPVTVINAAMGHIRQADLMLIAGSSLEVLPVSRLPLQVHERSGRLVMVNLTPTYVDELADVVIHADIADALPALARTCVEKGRR